MREREFYDKCDVFEGMEDPTNGYFPTVEELRDHGCDENPDKFANLLIYFSSDPLTKQGVEITDEKEYQDTVSYCKRKILEVELS